MTVDAVAGTPLGKLLSGLYLNLFLPAASSRAGLGSTFTLNANYPATPVAEKLIADGVDGLIAQYGVRARDLLTTSPSGNIQVNSGILIGFLANENDPVVQALGHWIMVSYGNVYIDGTGGDGRIPLVVVLRDGSVFLCHSGVTVLFGTVDTANPPFVRFFQALCNGLSTLLDLGGWGNEDTPGQIMTWHLAQCGQLPTLGTALYKAPVNLSTLVRMLVRNSALTTNAEGERVGGSLRAATASTLLGMGVGRCSIDTLIPVGAEHLRPILEAFYSAASGNSPIISTLRKCLRNAGPQTASCEALSSDSASVDPKSKKGSASKKPEADPDEANNAYRSDDSDESLADTVVSSSKSPVVNDNAMNSSYSRTNDTIDLIPLTAGDESGNAFYYRRAILALHTALENDPDANVSAEARKTLSLMCRDWLFLVSLKKVKETIASLGLSPLLTPMSTFAK